MQDTQAAEPTASAAGVYEKWLEVRCLFVGLRIAWVSVASALVGFALFLTAPPAQDILLETKGDLAADAAYWAKFYVLVILTWALPVFVSARWILTFTEERPNAPALFESLPRWVRQYIPALLVLLCFFAILVGQFIALRDAPDIVDDGREVFISDARSQDTKEGLSACRSSPRDEGCLRLATNLAVVAAADLLGASRGNEANYIYGFAAALLLWLALPTLLRSLLSPHHAARAVSMINLLLLLALVAAGIAAAAPRYARAAPAVVLAAIALSLWWRDRHRSLRWLTTACVLPVIGLGALAIYGIFEIERQSEFNLIHLLLLPPATMLAAALSWWWLRPRPDGKATLIGQILLRMTGSGSDALTDTAATTRLVNPIFATLLVGTATTIVALIVIHPLRVTEWGHRALLLPIVLGLPVAALTYLTYWSARIKAPLILAAIVVIGSVGVLATSIAGDSYRIRFVFLSDAPPRPDLSAAVEQWAKVNQCNLRNRSDYQRSCPPPIIVAAAGGASRAAFHTAGVLGKLLDDGPLRSLKGHSAAVRSAEYSPDGNLIVTAALDKTPRLWNAKTGQAVGTLVGHNLGVNSATFSPDGKRIVTASGTRARIWDVASFGRTILLKTLGGHEDAINSAGFSPDGTLVVTASDDETARVWDVASGEEKLRLLHSGTKVYSAAFRPGDGRQILTGAGDGLARIWNVPDRETLQDIRRSMAIETAKALRGHAKKVNGATWSPDGKFVATASDDKTARIWNASEGRELLILKGHGDRILGATFSPIVNDWRVVTGGWDRTARIWTLPDLGAIRERAEISDGTVLMAHRHGVNGALFSPDGKIIITASRDKTVRIWDATTGSRLEWPGETFPFPFRNQLFAISAVSGGALGAAVSYAALADSLRTDRAKNGLGKPPCVAEGLRDADWFVGTKQQGFVPEPSEDPRLSWKACLQLLVAGDFLSPVFVGMVSSDPFSINLHGDRAELIERAWETRYARLTGQDPGLGLILREKVKDFRDASTLAQPMSMVRDTTPGWLPLLFLNGTSVADGRRIVTSDIDTTIRTPRGEAVQQILLDAHDFHGLFTPDVRAHGHNDRIFTIDASSDGHRIVTASADKTARIWDVETGAELAVLQGHTDRVFSASFNPHGTRIVTAGRDKTARVWDVSDLKAVKHEASLAHGDEVNSAAFSPDGSRIASVSDDHTVRVWDAASAALLATFEGHTNIVLGVAFSPDGKRVASASQDKTARVWDVSNLQQPAAPVVLQGHTGTVNSVAFNRAGTLVVTASGDTTARIWHAGSGALVATLAGVHTGPLFHAAFSPDGKLVVTASGDDTMHVWDVADPNAVKPIRRHAHVGDVYSAVFNSDGSLIFTSSADKTASAWIPETGKRWRNYTSYETQTPCRGCDIRLSTAISMSARFPIISPPGSILDVDRRAITRVVDGGFHENFGALSVTELVRTLKHQFGLHAAVILINNEPKVSQMDCVTQGTGQSYLRQPATSWFPTLTTPLDTMVATRTARGSHAAVSLCKELLDARQRFAFVTVGRDEPLPGQTQPPHKDLSVSWWMSKRIQKHLDDQLAENRLNVFAFGNIAAMRRHRPIVPKSDAGPAAALQGNAP